jgi:hypothetical protein
MAAVSSTPWRCRSDWRSAVASSRSRPCSWSEFSAADYTLEQWRRACLVHPPSPSQAKDDYRLPVREPDGTLNRNAVPVAPALLRRDPDVQQVAAQAVRPVDVRLAALGQLHESGGDRPR